MNLIHHFLNIILHMDVYLVTFVNQYGNWVYGLLFLVIFCETGLVIFPFLPGDSLLFAAGALAASTTTAFNIHLLFILLVIASITGNTLNYLIGKFLGPKIFYSPDSWLLNKKYLENAHQFYEKHGPKAIIIARFIPIIRSFAPFVAGIGYMTYRRFTVYNIAGALLWIGTLLYVSFWFGNIPLVKNHFSTIVMAIIVISVLPVVFETCRQRYAKSNA